MLRDGKYSVWMRTPLCGRYGRRRARPGWQVKRRRHHHGVHRALASRRRTFPGYGFRYTALSGSGSENWTRCDHSGRIFTRLPSAHTAPLGFQVIPWQRIGPAWPPTSGNGTRRHPGSVLDLPGKRYLISWVDRDTLPWIIAARTAVDEVHVSALTRRISPGSPASARR
jgi:hypothetical protein